MVTELLGKANTWIALRDGAVGDNVNWSLAAMVGTMRVTVGFAPVEIDGDGAEVTGGE